MKKAVFCLSLAVVVLLAAGCPWCGRALQALAAEPAKAADAKTPQRFVISDFGAVADGKTVNTKAIQSAIDKCAAAGGGVVVVPKGTFSSGAIFLSKAQISASNRTASSRGPPISTTIRRSKPAGKAWKNSGPRPSSTPRA